MRESWSRWWWRPRDLEWRWPSDWMPVSFRMPRKLLPNIDWKFRVPDLNVVCNDRCETAALDCIIGCENDVNCISGCLRDQAECSQGKSVRGGRSGSIRMCSDCTVFHGLFHFPWLLITLHILDCPCEIGCLDGCDGCSNPVCQCEVSFSINHIAWSVDHWQIVIIITWFYRIWRKIKTGTTVLTIMVRPWADASTPVMATKAVKPNASMVSRSDKPTAHARYQIQSFSSSNVLI